MKRSARLFYFFLMTGELIKFVSSSYTLEYVFWQLKIHCCDYFLITWGQQLSYTRNQSPLPHLHLPVMELGKYIVYFGEQLANA